MIYFKYVPYLYLVAASFFLFDAYLRMQDNETPAISLAFAVIGIFMFFFRRRYPRKFDGSNRGK